MARSSDQYTEEDNEDPSSEFKALDPDESEEITTETVNDYLKWTIKYFEFRKLKNKELWLEFYEFFEGWTENTFSVATKPVRNTFRAYLMDHGVGMETGKGMPVARALYHVLQQENWIPVNSTSVEQTPTRPQVRFAPQPTVHQHTPDPVILRETRVSTQSAIQGLMKAYKEQEKYGGSTDTLDKCVRVFTILCRDCGVLPTEQPKAFHIMLKDDAREYYFDEICDKDLTLQEIVHKMGQHFETDSRRNEILRDWSTITLDKIIDKNPDKSTMECFEILFKELKRLQRGLAPSHYTMGSDHATAALRDQLLKACQENSECTLACFKPSTALEELASDIRASIKTKTLVKKPTVFLTNDEETFITERRYEGAKQNNNPNNSNIGWRSGSGGGYNNSRGYNRNIKKKCYVCHRFGCWSRNHTQEERNRSFNDWKNRQRKRNRPYDDQRIWQMMAMYEEEQELQDRDDIDQYLITIDALDDDTKTSNTMFHTSFGDINGLQTIKVLNESTAHYTATGQYSLDSYTSTGELVLDSTYINSDRYSSSIFQGILIDTGAARCSTAGYDQFKALQKLRNITLDKTRAGQAKIVFGIGATESIGTTTISTPVGDIIFHVVEAPTPFILCLHDMDTLGLEFRNLTNQLVHRNGLIVPIIRKYGHAFMLLNDEEHMTYSFVNDIQTDPSLLTDKEIRQLHRRFGHPSVGKLARILERSGHQVERAALEHLTKYCALCQKHSKSPGRFKFTLRDDKEFNFCIYVDVFQVDKSPVLHCVDESTRFQAGRWLKDMSAKEAWDMIRQCWIDSYLGPPDIIAHDAGTNFAADEFRQNAKTLGIQVKEVPVEAHNSIGRVERYHAPLRRAYYIIQEEMKDYKLDKASLLQMALKAINDTAAPDGLIPTLLVFGAYPRMVESDAPSPSTIQRAAAIQKAMEEVRKCYASRQVSDALNTRNGPRTSHLKGLPMNSKVLVWRTKAGPHKRGAWTGPHTLISIDNETCVVDLDGGKPTLFRSTVVKPYYEEADKNDDDLEEDNSETENTISRTPEGDVPEINPDEHDTPAEPPARRGPGRSPKDKSKPKETLQPTRRSPRNHQSTYLFITSVLDPEDPEAYIYLTEKEKLHKELSLKLREQGIITTPGEPFEQSRMKEFNGLMTRGIFNLEPYNPTTMDGLKICKTRLVNEIKGISTSTPYEKTRLVAQLYDDEDKKAILTQSPTIQRCSQRIILTLAPTLMANHKCKLGLRDVVQAYTQSGSKLNRLIIAKPPKELMHAIPEGMVMVIRGALYGIPESGVHWFEKYHTHHCEHLNMENSTYDPCLLITRTDKGFAVVGLQTDDTLILGNNEFFELEDSELKKAQIEAKSMEVLTEKNSFDFNGGRIIMKGSIITLTQKDQGSKLAIIDPKSPTVKADYIQQRARGAYIASVCQPEATCALSIAAQYQDPTEQEVKELNKVLQWQRENLNKGLTSCIIDLTSAKIYIFVDASFANNKDLSSQMGYVIIIANETISAPGEFTITGNIIHWSSVKCRRVTRSILASELYAMAHGADMAIAVGTTLKMITKQLDIKDIPIVICTDSLSLYECTVKLGTTKEKRLMIDIMAIRQLYEKRDIADIRWISGNDNPADAMTKLNPSRALQTFVDTNRLKIRMEGWVKREVMKDGHTD